MSDLSKIEELYKRIDELEEIVKEPHPTHAYFSADTLRELQLKAIRETIKEALYQLGRSAKYGGCSDAEVMSWVDPETILENLK